MAGYIGSKASVVSSGAERKKTFTITGATTSLTGLNYTVGKVHVFQNGVRLVDGTDYTATNGTTITLTVAAQSGDNVVVISQASFQVADALLTSGGTLTGDLSFGDNNKAKFGAGSDLQIYHDGSNNHTYIEETGSGSLRIRGENLLLEDSSGKDYLNAVADAQVELSHNGVKKFETTSTGVTVTQSGTDVGLLVTGGGYNYTAKFESSDAEANIIIEDSNSSNDGNMIGVATNDMYFITNSAERMRIDSSGAITTPTQPAFRVYTANNADITTQAIIEHDTKIHDRANNFNTSTHEFTAPVTGLYSFSSYHWHKTGTGGVVHLYLYVNGSNNHEIRNTRSASHGGYNRVGFTTTVPLSANDAVHVEASGHSGGELHTSSGSAHSQFSGYLIG
jgi:hypothetical protein